MCTLYKIQPLMTFQKIGSALVFGPAVSTVHTYSICSNNNLFLQLLYLVFGSRKTAAHHDPHSKADHHAKPTVEKEASETSVSDEVTEVRSFQLVRISPV
jgi:hypothetical protein